MKSWHRCAAGAVASALFLLLAAPALAQSPATPPATSAPETLPAPPVPAEAAPPRPEPPAVRPLQDRAPSGPAVRQPRDLSPWSMFLAADIVVKVVMVSLAFASLVTWTIFFAKTLQLSHAQARLRRALARVAEARTLSEAQKALDGRPTALTALVRAALHEVRLSGRKLERRRHQGAQRFPLYRDRARGGAFHALWHGGARHHRRDLAVCRAVRHRLGHHEQFHRHF
jgi:biopolymer transport protein ExbB